MRPVLALLAVTVALLCSQLAMTEKTHARGGLGGYYGGYDRYRGGGYGYNRYYPAYRSYYPVSRRAVFPPYTYPAYYPYYYPEYLPYVSPFVYGPLNPLFF